MTRAIDPTETIIGLAGDWHGETKWARRSIARMSGEGVRSLFHLGDFGIWPGSRGRQFISEMNGACTRYGVTIYVTPGNHEDYDQIDELPILDDGLAWMSDHIAVIPRGHRWTMGARTFVSLGGAPSLDFNSRIEGQSWWPAEAITEEDVERVVAGGHAEVMLTHDAPDGGTEVVNDILADNPFGWSNKSLAYASQGRAHMNRCFRAVAPALSAHGHLHVKGDALVTFPGTGNECQVLALNQAGHGGNLVVLDLEAEPIGWRWLNI